MNEIIRYTQNINDDVITGEIMNAKKIIDEASSLPVEERAFIIDSLLRGLNQPESHLDKEWGSLAQKRLEELRSGKVTPVPGEEVFWKIRKRSER